MRRFEIITRAGRILAAVALCAGCARPSDGTHVLHVLTTNDVHGCYFDSTYVGGNVRKSLAAVKFYVDSIRTAAGEDNVLLLDAGDCLQGDNAAYYFNYVDTVTPHVYPRVAAYMGYDAVVVGNHDVETGHHVFDRVAADFRKAGIPYLAGNAMRTDNGKPYFQSCAIFRKAGLKVAVLGYTNANIKAWLDESLWSGMTFESLLPLVQSDVDAVVAKEAPQVVVVAVHSGTGSGDGSELEGQGQDLLDSLHGVDLVVCSHDHRATVIKRDGACLVNAGSHCRSVSESVISVEVSDGKVASKAVDARMIDVDAAKTVPEMHEVFKADYDAVKAFTLREAGELKVDLRTRDAYMGMCDYMNLIHTVSIGCSPAKISFAAPLTYNGFVRKGMLVFNDMFTIYPYENQLFVVDMTGKEIKDYLEYSYQNWIRTIKSADEHVLRIAQRPDSRTGEERWSFEERSYNFDSAAGIVYTVDVTKPFGERVSVASMADGSAFESDAMYPVAMTSYRASGGGGLMIKGAGISPDEIPGRIMKKCPEIRDMIYDYIQAHGGIDPDDIGDASVLGSWSFVPEKMASTAMERDMKLLFPRYY